MVSWWTVNWSFTSASRVLGRWITMSSVSPFRPMTRALVSAMILNVTLSSLAALSWFQ